jgi:hypothetical protein
MSGGSSGGPSWPEPRPITKPKDGDGGGGGGGIPDAYNIQETTTLNSPDRTVISGLRTGDVLEVVFELGPPRRLVAKTSAGAVAGAITSPSLPQFIQCITQSNVRYTAEVLSVRGAVCQVRVQPQ